MCESLENQYDWHSHVRDMLKFCDRVSIYTAGLKLEEFVSDQRTYDATLRNIGLLGVAVSYIPEEVRQAHAGGSLACHHWFPKPTCTHLYACRRPNHLDSDSRGSPNLTGAVAVNDYRYPRGELLVPLRRRLGVE